MKNRILPLVLLIIICFAMVCPFSVHAITPLDTAAEASLTLHYQKDDVAFANLPVGIYRVAEALPDGTFELIAPFSSYPVNIHDITEQTQWHNVAQTLYSYIVANQVDPDREAKTEANGKVCFSNLKTGLYFVREVVAENTVGTYVFNQFMVYVPTPQPDGIYTYAVEANPKCTNFVPRTQYTVTKLWQDNGNQSTRPDAVTVDIYKDGALQETQILIDANNWSYTWYVPGDDYGKWTVTERSVPDSYKATIQQNGEVFSIINTCQTEPGIPPQTGDTFTPLPWIVTMCFSGIMLLILGIYSRRRKV